MEINHNHQRQRFTAFVDDREVSLSYNLEDHLMNIIKVEVPVELRGQGLAEKITLHAFEHAKREGYKIIPTCPYVRDKFLKEHHEFDNLLN